MKAGQDPHSLAEWARFSPKPYSVFLWKDLEGWLEFGLKGNVQGLLWVCELKIPMDVGEVAHKGP